MAIFQSITFKVFGPQGTAPTEKIGSMNVKASPISIACRPITITRESSASP